MSGTALERVREHLKRGGHKLTNGARLRLINADRRRKREADALLTRGIRAGRVFMVEW